MSAAPTHLRTAVHGHKHIATFTRTDTTKGATRMRRTMSRLGIALALLSILPGCGKNSPTDEAESRLDAATTLNVCGFVSQADVEGIFGPLVGPWQSPSDRQPQQGSHGKGVAGTCGWSFKSASGNSIASLSAMYVTHGSNIGNPYPLDPWSKVNMGEVEATIGPNPVAIEGLGDKALLFQSPQQLQSEVWMQQGGTFAVVRVTGASSTQLVSFARLLANGAIAMESTSGPGTTSAEQPGSSANDHAPAAGVLANGQQQLKDAQSNAADADEKAKDAQAQARDAADKVRQDQAEEEIAVRAVVEHEECTRVDDLLRRSCAAFVQSLPEKDKVYCNLPAETFAARSASSYGSFKEANSAAIQKHQPEISAAVAEANADFDQQYAQDRAGTVSGMDLFSMSHDLNRCP